MLAFTTTLILIFRIYRHLS